MNSQNDIRIHMKSVGQTRKITNAMYLIASSRMNRALYNLEHNKAHFSRAFVAMKEIRTHTNINHPYLIHRKNSNKTAFIIIAGDRGLAGNYNHEILKLADKSMQYHDPTHIFSVGSVGVAHFKKEGREVNEQFTHIAQAPTINTARNLTNIIMELYDKEIIDELRVVYTLFENTQKQTPIDIELLPIELGENTLIGNVKISNKENILYEPSVEEVMNELVPQFIIGYIYGALINAYASENFARMNAMEQATENADEIQKKLTHEYHRARQISITNELAEISGTANAMKKFSKQ